MERNILNLKKIFFFISLFITLISADNIRIPGFKWEKIDVISEVGQDLPEERRDYAIGYNSEQNEIIIFGGRTVDNKVLGDTWIFNVDSHTWRKPAIDTVNPPNRFGMVYGNDQPSSNSYRNTFVITGGKGSKDEFYNDVWSFDFIRECWVEIKATGDIPEPRYDAIGGIDLTKWSHLNQLSTEYLILSHGKNDKKYFTDTYILKLDGRSQQGDYSKLTAEWSRLNTNNAPVLKDGPTGGILSADRMVIFGGCEEGKGNCNGNGYFLDINFDDLRTKVEGVANWQELPNECIRPKAYAASTRGSDPSLPDVTDNDRLIIFGGLTEKKYGEDVDGEISIFDMDKQKFFGVKPSSASNELPKATKGAKMIATKSKNDNTLMSWEEDLVKKGEYEPFHFEEENMEEGVEIINDEINNNEEQEINNVEINEEKVAQEENIPAQVQIEQNQQKKTLESDKNRNSKKLKNNAKPLEISNQNLNINANTSENKEQIGNGNDANNNNNMLKEELLNIINNINENFENKILIQNETFNRMKEEIIKESNEKIKTMNDALNKKDTEINKLNNQHKEELSSISTNKNKGNILNDKN